MLSDLICTLIVTRLDEKLQNLGCQHKYIAIKGSTTFSIAGVGIIAMYSDMVMWVAISLATASVNFVLVKNAASSYM